MFAKKIYINEEKTWDAWYNSRDAAVMPLARHAAFPPCGLPQRTGWHLWDPGGNAALPPRRPHM